MGGNAGGVTVPGRDELIAALEKDLAAVDKKLVPDDVVKHLMGSEFSILKGYCNDPLVAPVLLKLVDTMLESNVIWKDDDTPSVEVFTSGAEVAMGLMLMMVMVASESGQEISQALETGVAQKLPQVFYKMAAENEKNALDALYGMEGESEPGSLLAKAAAKTVTNWQQARKSALDRAVTTMTQNLHAAAEAQRDAFDEKQRQLKALAPKIKIRPAGPSPG